MKLILTGKGNILKPFQESITTIICFVFNARAWVSFIIRW